MSLLSDAMKKFMGRLGRPPDGSHIHAADLEVDRLDDRLTTVEKKQLELQQRLRLLEIQSNPRPGQK